jgi:xanthine phosphoribosyltransferase
MIPTSALVSTTALLVVVSHRPLNVVAAFSAHPSSSSSLSFPIITSATTTTTHPLQLNLAAKRKRGKVGSDESDIESWYDEVNGNASPEDVFWEEMERRRLLNRLPDESPLDSLLGAAMDGDSLSSSIAYQATTITGTSSSSSGASSLFVDELSSNGSGSTTLNIKNAMQQMQITIEDEKSAEASLAAYSAYATSDNYLYDDDNGDDEYNENSRNNDWRMRNDPALWMGEEQTLAEEDAELDRQLDELERELMGDGIDGSVVGGSSPYFDPTYSDEPWDRYGQSRRVEKDDSDDDDARGNDNSDKTDNMKGNNDMDNIDDDDDDDNDDDSKGKSVFQKELQRKMDMISHSAPEFMLDYDEEHPEEADAEARAEEEEYAKSLASISITSARLENAAVNPRAEAYFKRPPDERQGYDTMWVSAVDTPCVKNLYGIFSNYGVQFADNFDDWDEGSGEEHGSGDGFRSIEDIASYKARRVYEVTGLPCVASRTSFEVEPIRPEDMDKGTELVVATAGGKKTKQVQKSPRVVTGYRFNNIGEHVDRIVQALLPFSEPTRVTRFRSCVCYYDGELELFEYGELDCDLYFAGSMRTFLPMSSAINSMLKSLELALDLQFQKWLRAKFNDATGGGAYSDASLKLRDRVLKEAKLLPNDIIDVSSFMNGAVDVNLMDQCGKDLADRFVSAKPSKILTIATTGLVIAIPMAKYLQVPLVYARKQRSVVMANTFDAGYNSKTIGQDQQLLVSRDHLDEDDRVLIVDDFLSSGSSQEALLRIINEAGAAAVGVAVLLEKEYEAGRVSLSGFGVPVESVVRIASVRDGVIQLLEEDGYDHM